MQNILERLFQYAFGGHREAILSERQTPFNGWKQFSADPGPKGIPLRMEIGSILYRKEIDEGTDSSPLIFLYCNNFNDEQRQQIESVFQKIRLITPAASNEVNFSCTFVHAYYKQRKIELVLFQIMQPSFEILLVEPSGRVYENWNHFKKSNRLPDRCEYFATVDGRIQKFKKLKISYYIRSIAELIAYLAIDWYFEAPVAYSFLLINMLRRTASTIIDRYEHKESLRPNTETINCYLVLVAAIFTLSSFAAVAFFENIFQFSALGVQWGKLVFTFSVFGVLCLYLYTIYINLVSFVSAAKELGCLSLFLPTILLVYQLHQSRQIHMALAEREFYTLEELARRLNFKNTETRMKLEDFVYRFVGWTVSISKWSFCGLLLLIVISYVGFVRSFP